MPRRFMAVISKEEKWYVAHCLELGVVSQGKTKDDAIRNIREAIEGFELTLREDGLPVPPEKFDALLVAV